MKACELIKECVGEESQGGIERETDRKGYKGVKPGWPVHLSG